MNIDGFLDLQGLEEALQLPVTTRRRRNIDTAVWQVLDAGEGIDRLDLAKRFRPYDDTPIPLQLECEQFSTRTAVAILNYHRQEGLHLDQGEEAKSVARQMRKAVELGALLEAADITQPEALMLFDACGGAGHLGFAAHELRHQLDLSTRSICVDFNPAEATRFNFFHQEIAPHASAEFQQGDVSTYPFKRAPERTVLMAKHACGPASEFLVNRIKTLERHERPDNSVVMTCCHGKRREQTIFDSTLSRTGISRDEWNNLLVLSEWVGSSLDARRTIGRVAMRIVDVIRTELLPDDIDVSVTELLPSTLARKNHAIIMKSLL